MTEFLRLWNADFEGRKSRFGVPNLATHKGEAEHWRGQLAGCIIPQKSKPEKAICEFTKMGFVSSPLKAKVGETLESKVAHKSLCDNLLAP